VIVGAEEGSQVQRASDMPEGRPVLIVRPGDGRGRVGRESPEVVDFLRSQDVDPVVVDAVRTGEGARRAKAAIDSGERFLVAVGGDALVREVADAILASGSSGLVTMAVVAAGSGCDFVRTFGLPGDARSAAPRLLTGVSYPIDAVRVTCSGADGRPTTTHFAGLARVGFGGLAQRRAGRLPSWMGRAGYFGAFWSSVATFRPVEVHVVADERQFRGRAHDVVVGNTQHALDGIPLSPRSFPGDGVLDVLVMRGPTSDQFRLLPTMMWGEQVPSPGVVEFRVRTSLRVESSRPLWVEADTEPLGRTPAEFELLPHALLLKV